MTYRNINNTDSTVESNAIPKITRIALVSACASATVFTLVLSCRKVGFMLISSPCSVYTPCQCVFFCEARILDLNGSTRFCCCVSSNVEVRQLDVVCSPQAPRRHVSSKIENLNPKQQYRRQVLV